MLFRIVGSVCLFLNAFVYLFPEKQKLFDKKNKADLTLCCIFVYNFFFVICYLYFILISVLFFVSLFHSYLHHHSLWAICVHWFIWFSNLVLTLVRVSTWAHRLIEPFQCNKKKSKSRDEKSGSRTPKHFKYTVFQSIMGKIYFSMMVNIRKWMNITVIWTVINLTRAKWWKKGNEEEETKNDIDSNKNLSIERIE